MKRVLGKFYVHLCKRFVRHDCDRLRDKHVCLLYDWLLYKLAFIERWLPDDD